MASDSSTLPIPENDCFPIEVRPRLFIGSGMAARNRDALKAAGITHVINAAGSFCFPRVDSDISYMVMEDFHDSPDIDIEDACFQASRFIVQALAESPDSKVLVHCVGGVSRSAALVTAYLIISEELTLAEALELVRQVRPCIRPNPGFLTQLDSIAQLAADVRAMAD